MDFDVKTRKEKENSIKIILFLDVGGSMDDYVLQVENLFSAAKNVFKNLNFFSIFIIVYMKVFGRIILGDGKNNSLLQKFLEHIVKIINVYL